jgi:hypothetical protein
MDNTDIKIYKSLEALNTKMLHYSSFGALPVQGYPDTIYCVKDAKEMYLWTPGVGYEKFYANVGGGSNTTVTAVTTLLTKTEDVNFDPINELTQVLEADSIYEFRLFVLFKGDSASGIIIQGVLPAGADSFAEYKHTTLVSTPLTITQPWNGSGAGSAERLMNLYGVIRTAGTSGDLIINWRQRVSHIVPSEIVKGTYLKLTKLN